MFPQMMPRHGATGPITIPLLSVVGRSQLVTVSWPGGSDSIEVANSTILSCGDPPLAGSHEKPLAARPEDIHQATETPYYALEI